MSDDNFLLRLQKALNSILPSQPTEIDDTPVIEKSQVLKSINVEEQKAIEVVYKPDCKDAHEEWMSASTIEKGEASFRNNEVSSNLFHLVETDRFSITKSWLLDKDTDFQVDTNTKTLSKGTWLAEVHYSDNALWELKKSNELGGLSLGGYGDVNKETGEITNLCFSEDEYLAIHNEESK